ncbi:PH domain-containing protein [Mycolicibacterium anyangense]|nr:PH domain-containing protein [Mycolicibacterium anyangense]
MSSGSAPDPIPATTAPGKPVVIRLSPMAHFASGFLALGLLALVAMFPAGGMALLVIPVVLSAAIIRLRTVADRETVTARTLLGSRTVRWDEVAGLRFERSGWAKAELTDGGDLLLPAVTFATLPRLTAATDGRVPNPYR